MRPQSAMVADREACTGSSMETVVGLKGKVLGWFSSLGGFRGEGTAERLTILRISLRSWTDDTALILDGFGDLIDRPMRFVVQPGEPILNDGSRVRGGNGLLHFVREARTIEEIYPADVTGRLWLTDGDFDALQAILPHYRPCQTDLHLALTFGHGDQLQFRMPDTFTWDHDAHAYLSISACEVRMSSVDGWE